MRSKFKILSTTKSEFDTASAHARSLGAYSRDNDYGFNPQKTALTIETDGRMLKSSPNMKPVAGPKPIKISVREFLGFTSLNDINGGTKAPDCTQAVDDAVAQSATVCAAIIQDMHDASPCSQETLVVTACEVSEQNSLLFRTIGLPKLEALGIDVVRDGDKNYIIDITKNESVELTAKYASECAKRDLLDGEVSPWSIWAKEHELITSLTMTKVVDKD
jgi:hypothetical protein